jgi:hypothetical protein
MTLCSSVAAFEAAAFEPVNGLVPRQLGNFGQPQNGSPVFRLCRTTILAPHSGQRTSSTFAGGSCFGCVGCSTRRGRGGVVGCFGSSDTGVGLCSCELLRLINQMGITVPRTTPTVLTTMGAIRCFIVGDHFTFLSAGDSIRMTVGGGGGDGMAMAVG